MLKNIKIRSMTYDEFEAYQDYIDDLKDEGMKEERVGRKAARWVIENIYKIDLTKNNITPGTVMQIVADTTEATLKAEDLNEKN